MEELRRVSFSLKDLPQALELRNHVIRCVEAAAQENDREKREAWTRFVVVGGGPTGVEYAGALSELVRLVLSREYPDVDLGRARVILVEAGDRVLAPFDRSLSAAALSDLDRLGVDVRLNGSLEEASVQGVRLSSTAYVAARTVVWAAGIRPSGLIETLPGERSRQGRIKVDEYLRLPEHEDVFIAGDVASVPHPSGGELPAMCPPAIQAGKHSASNILRGARGQPPQPFRYVDKGIVATIGRNSAVMQFKRLRVRGFIGWVFWLTLHLFYSRRLPQPFRGAY